MLDVNTASERRIIEKVFAAGQEQVFRFWNELTPPSQRKLLTQLDEFDFQFIRALADRYLLSPDENKFQGRLEPASIIAPDSGGSNPRRKCEAQRLGEKALEANQVAALVVAGGQGTRLGFNGPKGIFPVGPITQRSLFQLFAEKVRALEARYHTHVPWYIMTSQQNDAATKSFFEEQHFLGLDINQTHFFTQGVMPALTPNGKMILDAKDHVFVNPDGHGGTLVALHRSGALEQMRRQGIRWVFYFQVDNVLVKMCDPLFLGYHILRDAEMSAKVVPKRDPYEKVGVIGQVDGKVKVIEYSDLSLEEMEARNADGQLKYNGGNIAIHILNVAFIEKLVKNGIKLPFHKAFKEIPTVDEHGRVIMPKQPNGYKFEMFVFDALPLAREVVVMEVRREFEFSPIKNASGFDSPETAQLDMNNLYGRWIEQCGGRVPRDSAGNVAINIEISPLVASGADDLQGKIPSEIDQDFLLA